MHSPETSCHAERVTLMSVAMVVFCRMCLISVRMLSVSCFTSNDGQLSPPSFSGAYITASGVFRLILTLGSSTWLMAELIFWHCLGVNLVTAAEYPTLGITRGRIII